MGLEPTTPCLKGRCSNQLSYGPMSAKKALLNYTATEVVCQLLPTLVTILSGLGKEEIDNSEDYPDANDNFAPSI